eukprot:TRINITY_DN68304_c0_g1_i1.p1 TRINITY_DN68304_c0_g1~~TRINITY_DN68304_c0_g1_i1.p1  ORF type:complete len:554 (-),score=30.14 TRINITY_DN68304_c0_g1_i1:206-1867(-)
MTWNAWPTHIFLLICRALPLFGLPDTFAYPELPPFTDEDFSELARLVSSTYFAIRSQWLDVVGIKSAVITLRDNVKSLMKTSPDEFRNLEWVAAQADGWLSALETDDRTLLERYEYESCILIPELLSGIYEAFLMTSDAELTELLEQFRSTYQAGSIVLSMTPSCCKNVVNARLTNELKNLYRQEKPWTLKANTNDLFWLCLEHPFWSDDGRFKIGVRGLLWQVAVEANNRDMYAVFEPLTVQISFMPLCILRTFEYRDTSAKHKSIFDYAYSNCAPTQMAYAIDHLLLSGTPKRAEEAFQLMSSFSIKGRSLVNWTSFHATSIAYVPNVAQWPWWQNHPKIKPYVNFLEGIFDILSSECYPTEKGPDFQDDFFPATSQGGIWSGLDFWTGEAKDPEKGYSMLAQCAVRPRTCAAMESLGWRAEDDIITRKQGYSIVAPRERMGGHSGQHLRINIQMCVSGCEGAVLHLNGSAIRYVPGKALAWQDGWRHEITNSGSAARWVFMITVPHPDLEVAWQRGAGHWPWVYHHLKNETVGEETVRILESTASPWARM